VISLCDVVADEENTFRETPNSKGETDADREKAGDPQCKS
jgi:hypothetical protein